MKIAFLILNHRPPAQLLRLVATLRQQLSDAPIVVHHDRFRARLDRSALGPIKDVHLLTSDSPLMWGDFSVVNACWHSMAWMTENISFDWLILLSGQDYPIKPLTGLGDYLAATGADAFLRAVPISEISPAVHRRDMRRRYLYQYRPAAKEPQAVGSSGRLRRGLRRSAGPFVRIFNNVQPLVYAYKFPDPMPYRIGRRARSSPFTAAQPCWFGSTWISLSCQATKLLVSTVQDEPNVVEHYKNTICPSESASATLLCNMRQKLQIEQQELHYVRWTQPRTGHPDVFTSNDFAELVEAPYYFARKFDVAKDAEIFDKLDQMLMTPDRVSGRLAREV